MLAEHWRMHSDTIPRFCSTNSKQGIDKWEAKYDYHFPQPLRRRDIERSHCAGLTNQPRQQIEQGAGENQINQERTGWRKRINASHSV